jgi:type IV secretion system protein VirB5
MILHNILRKYIAAFAVGAAVFGSPAANAGIPVIDVAALTQAIQEVVAWGQQYGQMTQQYQQMLQQYQQLVQQYNALTGTRNLGDILNNPALRQAVPSGTQLMSSYSSINANGFGGLSNAAQALRSATAIYNCEGRSGADLQLCQAASVTNAQNQANYQSALDLMSQRTTQIQSLQTSINATSDPKSIAELQARIAAETTQVNNDANRLALMRALADSQDRLLQQQYRERELKMLNNPASTLDTFVYTPH